ncbi:uncharacterized protein F5891DRAFT_1148724 [Suillus fuscotomentosus]|uniref:Uncharacterized protein n=1 Tax=Suillus fuscotomentosus TaxID=1912939 RepID=A0AAD4E1H8_9AGAM|nr:uncharacterized protein F5891DRAFT_1148724 [Suillus fuscotomentosus]KAG1897966.1 hypothetical protein F5891DRAFT_1148724 [Suillus fuscotomentosus]
MIIQDEDDLLNSKDPPVTTPALRYPERAAGRRPFSPLPDYETSQALAFNDLNNDSLVTFYKRPPKRRFVDSRSWRAGIAALGMYIILSIVIGIPLIVKTSQENAKSFSYTSNYAVPWLEKITTTTHYVTNINNLSTYLANGSCNGWATIGKLDDAQHSTVGQLLNTVSPDGRFSITSNASYPSSMNIVLGDLFVGINPNISVTDTTISVQMQASNDDLFDQTQVCSALSNDATGLAIYIPDNMSFNDQLLFNITLLYPQTSITAQVDSFATYLPFFTQTFGNLGGYVNFKKVYIEGPVSRIFVGSIEASEILVETSLEPIFGQFAASRSLTVSTIQAPINVNASLFNDPDSRFPTYLEVNTGNSNLTANVTLNAPNRSPPQRPNFIANIRTFYGQATASFVHDPTSPPTALKLRLENDLGPVDAMFDQYFQGLFQADAKLGTVSVTQGTASSLDPFDATLARSFLPNYVSDTRTYGWIGWGPDSGGILEEQIGEVVVETSIANCTLFFDG